MLRVGYNSNNVPFAFFNSKGELVGYDVEMAYDLARTLNVSRIEFVPITGTTLAESLDSGYCDIVMSAVVVNTDRLDVMKFTDPTVTVHLAFVVPNGRKDAFTQLDSVKKMDRLRVAVLQQHRACRCRSPASSRTPQSSRSTQRRSSSKEEKRMRS